MAAKKPVLDKKYFTVAEANARLPLVRSIVQDIVELARDLRERQERLARLQRPPREAVLRAYQEELQQAQAEFERDHEKLLEYEQELRDLGVELKDCFTGLVDFPCWVENREVYLCWRLGEPEVGYWHELHAGFPGRQKLKTQASKN